MANEDIAGKTMFCVVCKTVLSGTRTVTCSKECAEIRKRIQRKKTVDDKECRFCHKASTPNARKAFSRFRRWERDNPALAYPSQWAILEPAGVSLEEFGKAIVQAVKFDVEFGSHLSGFESTKLPAAGAMPKEMDRVLRILAATQLQEVSQA